MRCVCEGSDYGLLEQHFSCRIGRDSFSIDYVSVFHLLWGRCLKSKSHERPWPCGRSKAWSLGEERDTLGWKGLYAHLLIDARAMQEAGGI